MPAILFVFSVLVFFIFDKKIKEILLFLVLIIFFILTLFKFYSETRLIINIKTFYLSSSKIFTQIHDLNNYNKKIEEGSFKPGNNGYILLFNTGIHLWKDNKFFGNGLKSFKINCTYKPGQTCSTHPHNYTLEILLDTGVVGLATIYLIFILSTLDFIKFYKRGSNLKLLYLPFFLIILTEFFPIRSTGSFFTTSNASQIFFMLAITIAISNSKKN